MIQQRSMSQPTLDVETFHLATDTPVVLKPKVPDPGRRWLRASLIREEVVEELLPYLEIDDEPADEAEVLAHIGDAIADSIYVLIGTALEFGIPLPKIWDAVQAANMAKVDPTTGKVRKREDGKVLKPEGWTPPDIEGIIKEAMK
jgi:predicted HAD superfamily Cof-like phosphohydrolase